MTVEKIMLVAESIASAMGRYNQQNRIYNVLIDAHDFENEEYKKEFEAEQERELLRISTELRVIKETAEMLTGCTILTRKKIAQSTVERHNTGGIYYTGAIIIWKDEKIKVETLFGKLDKEKRVVSW